jgi:hypothetical protein
MEALTNQMENFLKHLYELLESETVLLPNRENAETKTRNTANQLQKLNPIPCVTAEDLAIDTGGRLKCHSEIVRATVCNEFLRKRVRRVGNKAHPQDNPSITIREQEASAKPLLEISGRRPKCRGIRRCFIQTKTLGAKTLPMAWASYDSLMGQLDGWLPGIAW